MEMNEVLSLLPALLAGIILGGIFFGGLLITVRMGLSSKRPTLIFLVSMILRMAIVIMGFYYVGGDSWQKILVCLGGFLIARIVITQIAKKDRSAKPILVKEDSDEN